MIEIPVTLSSKTIKKIKLETENFIQINQYKYICNFTKKYFFVKLKKIKNCKSIDLYKTNNNWHINTNLIINEENYLFVISPWIEVINPFFEKNFKSLIKMCLEMVQDKVFYTDWYDEKNFTTLDNKTIVIDVDDSIISNKNIDLNKFLHVKHYMHTLISSILFQKNNNLKHSQKTLLILANNDFDFWISLMKDILIETEYLLDNCN